MPPEKEDLIENEIVIIEDPVEEEQKASGEIDSSKEDEDEKAAKKKRRGSDGNQRRGNDSDKRIKELWVKQKATEEEAAKERKNAALERSRTQEFEKIAHSFAEENITIKRDLLKERLIAAQTAEDHKKVAEITAELSKVEAQGAQVDRYKIENQINAKAAPAQDDTQKREPVREQAPLSFDDIYENEGKAGKEWLTRNRDWFDNGSDDFDEDKASDVSFYASKLEANFNSLGVGFPPGSKGYYRQIDDYIKQNWADEEEGDVEEETQEKKPAFQQKTQGAPATNRGVQQKPPGAKQVIKLTQSEKEMALSMDAKNAQGKPLSDDEKIMRFLKIKGSTPTDGPISMKTLRRT